MESRIGGKRRGVSADELGVLVASDALPTIHVNEVKTKHSGALLNVTEEPGAALEFAVV